MKMHLLLKYKSFKLFHNNVYYMLLSESHCDEASKYVYTYLWLFIVSGSQDDCDSIILKFLIRIANKRMRHT